MALFAFNNIGNNVLGAPKLRRYVMNATRPTRGLRSITSNPSLTVARRAVTMLNRNVGPITRPRERVPV